MLMLKIINCIDILLFVKTIFTNTIFFIVNISKENKFNFVLNQSVTFLLFVIRPKYVALSILSIRERQTV